MAEGSWTSVRCYDDARTFVVACMNAIGRRDREDVLEAYLGVAGLWAPQPKKRTRAGTSRGRGAVSRQRGGGATQPTFHDRVLTLLSQAERKHDFGKAVDASVVPTELAVPTRAGSVTIAREATFISQCLTKPTLTFQGLTARANPMYVDPIPDSAVETRQLTLFKADVVAQDLERLRAQGQAVLASERAHDHPLWHADVWNTTRAPVSAEVSIKMRIMDVVNVLRCLRDRFGDEGRFMVDTCAHNPVVKLMVALRLIDCAFWKTYVIEDVDDDGDGSTAIRDVESLRQAVRRQMPQDVVDAWSEWRILCADASWFDSGDWCFESGAQHHPTPPPDVMVDPRPTGAVFPRCFPVQVRLKGVSADGSTVTAVIKDRETNTTKTLAWPKCKFAKLSRANLMMVLQGDDAGVDDRDLKRLRSLSPAAIHAIKCAGDWGQVEWCRAHGGVFVTGDALAALYAFVRRVPCLYVHVHTSGGSTDASRASVERYAFTLMRIY